MTNDRFGRLRKCARSIDTWINTYQLTIRTAFSLAALMALSFWGLYAFIDFSITKARSIQSELFDRDLRDLANHFDADERFVLEHNLTSMTALTRPLAPLLLPHQYYVSLTAGRSRSIPRQPPRNCFVDLIASDSAQHNALLGADRFCAYFIENRLLASLCS